MTLMLLISIAVGIIMVQIYEVPTSGVLTTSGLFIAIIGFALRSLISDLFTGIALGIERPFSVGDWIQVPDGTVGRVKEPGATSLKFCCTRPSPPTRRNVSC